MASKTRPVRDQRPRARTRPISTRPLAGRVIAWPDERRQPARLERGRRGADKINVVPHRRTRIRVGTASWTDPGFIADWYPKGLPPRERLAWYAEHFNLVEVNSSFYAIPSPSLVARWCEQTPAGFVFDVKLHRLLSRHSTQVQMLPRDLRKLAGTGTRATWSPKLEAAVARRFLEAIGPFVEAGKLGALLLQLSPSFGPRKHKLEELDSLVELFADYPLAVELRHREWVEGDYLDATKRFFAARQVTLVSVDAPASAHFTVMPGLDLVTNRRLAYLRAHGRNARGYISGRSVAERFDYDYSDAEIRQLAERAAVLAGLTFETHVVFNNNKSSYAPEAGARFRQVQKELFPDTTGAAAARQ